MKMIKDKELLVGADFAGFPLKEAVVAHLKAKGWKITDVGVRSPEDDDTDLMFHRIGLRVGSMISEGEFERALIFCGTGMGIHIAASKCPHVHAGVVESVPAALRAITGNGVNVPANAAGASGVAGGTGKPRTTGATGEIQSIVANMPNVPLPEENDNERTHAGSIPPLSLIHI